LHKNTKAGKGDKKRQYDAPERENFLGIANETRVSLLMIADREGGRIKNSRGDHAPPNNSNPSRGTIERK